MNRHAVFCLVLLVAGACSIAVTGSAWAGSITPEPPALDFGALEIQSKAPRTIQLENGTAGSVTIEAMALTGEHAAKGEFALAAPVTPLTLLPMTRIGVDVVFQPTGMSGDRRAALEMTVKDEIAPTLVPVTGQSVGLSALPGEGKTIVFPDTDVGATSLPIRLTLQDLANVNVRVPSVRIFDADPRQPQPSDAFGASLDTSRAGTATLGPFEILLPPGSTGVYLTFFPRSETMYAGTLELALEGANLGPARWPLQGSGWLTLECEPGAGSTIDFGQAQVGTSAEPQSLVVVSRATSAQRVDLTIDGPPFIVDQASFEVPAARLPRLGSAGAHVSFVPEVAGKVRGAITARLQPPSVLPLCTIALRGEGIDAPRVDAGTSTPSLSGSCRCNVRSHARPVPGATMLPWLLAIALAVRQSRKRQRGSPDRRL